MLMQVLIEREDAYHTKWLQSNFYSEIYQHQSIVRATHQRFDVDLQTVEDSEPTRQQAAGS